MPPISDQTSSNHKLSRFVMFAKQTPRDGIATPLNVLTDPVHQCFEAINAYDSKHYTVPKSKQLLTAHLLCPWIKTKHPNDITCLTNPKTALGTSCCHTSPQQCTHRFAPVLVQNVLYIRTRAPMLIKHGMTNDKNYKFRQFLFCYPLSFLSHFLVQVVQAQIKKYLECVSQCVPLLGSSSNRDREKWPKTVSLSSCIL